MFSKAKRFEPVALPKNVTNVPKKPEPELPKCMKSELELPKCKKPEPELPKCKPKLPPVVVTKTKTKPATTPLKPSSDSQSVTSSTKSVKSFATPKPVKPITKAPTSVTKTFPLPKKEIKKKTSAREDLMTSQEVEIRNKDYTIAEYNKQIEELKNEIANLHKLLKSSQGHTTELEVIDKNLAKITLDDATSDAKNKLTENEAVINDLKNKIFELEQQCDNLEREVNCKQVELTSLEEVITVRDGLCKDLQEKLTNMETCLEEIKQRLEMVKGHHALALEANESIRREYKAELETLKSKFEEEKQIIVNKSKADQENIKTKYNNLIETIKSKLVKEKDELINELQHQLTTKEMEMKAKLEQIDEATHEKIRLCEIQFEERSQNIQELWAEQQKKIQYLEQETKDLKYSLNKSEDQNMKLQKEINSLKHEIDVLNIEKTNLAKEADDLKEESKKRLIDFENEINKLTLELDKATKEKNKFELSLSLTRDIVQVLTMRLRESDSELEHLESQVQTLTDSKEVLENEVATYKTTLNNTVSECNEYKEALVNILKSKAALAKEHNRIMEHNVTLIESLQNVEKEAYRELGSIKSELIEDVEMLKKESNSHILMLKEEVQKKRMLCELATEQAGQAAAAAEQSRALLAHAAEEIARLEADNQRLQQQIEDQQSLVVELSLLRQENEELATTVAKQSSMMDKLKKDADQVQSKPKSPSVMRKTHKTGKENLQVVVSPLRERNH